MQRRFEYVGGASAKFWEITQVLTEVNVRYGRMGTNGQQQTKSFEDTETAKRHAEKLIGEKIRKGYVECVAN